MSDPVRLSVVTVCMNRREHLLATAPRLAAWPHHDEHLIVDWSSRTPLRRDELPDDPRLRLLRVEGEKRWHLCRAYNFGLDRARGGVILKLDADAWPATSFDPGDPALRLPGGGRIWAMGTGPEGRRGQLLIEKELLEAVGGFHELLVGYGFDDKDLQARLQLLLGEDPARIPADWLEVIPHSDEERAEQRRAASRQALGRSLGLAAMRSSRLANRLLAAHHPWGPRRPASRYEETSPGIWRVICASVPRATAETADEVDHARRMEFWSCFLAIPDIFLAELPPKLVPPSRQGHWPVRWWHRLWWHTGRRLLQAPVMVLALGRGRLEALRRLGRSGPA